MNIFFLFDQVLISPNIMSSFLYESVFRSFSVDTVCVCSFFCKKEIREKAACKMFVKFTPGVFLFHPVAPFCLGQERSWFEKSSSKRRTIKIEEQNRFDIFTDLEHDKQRVVVCVE